MKIAIVQTNPTVGEFDANVEELLRQLRRAHQSGCNLAVCPELAIVGYPPRDLLDRPSFVADGLAALSALAGQTPLPTIVGFVQRAEADGTVYLSNAAAYIDGGTVRSIHEKTLLPTYDVFDEWRYFRAGGPQLLADVRGVAVGISICEDVWNDGDFWPSRKYRRDPIEEQVALGAEVLVNLSASPFGLGKRALRTKMLAAQAKKHGLPLLMANQVGGNDDLIFEGGSLAIDKGGTVRARASEFATELLMCEVEVSTGSVTGPLADRHDDSDAGECAAALEALTLGVADYARKCGFATALIALSGGIDSAVTAAIAVRALGSNSIRGIALPSKYSSEHSLTDARALASALGIDFQTLPIEGIVEAARLTLSPALGGPPSGLTDENLQARARAIVVMGISNATGRLVLTTGNKSELAVGYCTLYGDMSGGLAVLSDVPKTLVYRLAEEINRQADASLIPRSTIEKPPSAELRPDQKDQDSLPPYAELDDIIAAYIDQSLSRTEIIARGHRPATVDHILSLIWRSEYKRRQAAPGLKLHSKAFGPGHRIPIASHWGRT